ncbi:hypothetical protein SAMN04487969_102241 [Paenibacillus algorifonticola]|uniref:Uncharacterized protein n=1 Tax=Paenibacillus algorifonticola TaxID=684063 RepID=A0A1I2A1N4_9BACL|nr:hypothetical protein [Paenibacillus algorifonticola]SFE37882.1 hypothetical protein SAMN04487969_102241 [Paenibacillus algorifonticola]
MAGILIISALAITLAVIELPKLAKKGWKKEIFVYLIMLAGGAFLSICAFNQIRLPSPLNIIVYIYKPLENWFNAF